MAGVDVAAVRTDFAAALTRTLWFEVGVFGASFALMLALPAGAGRRRPAGAVDASPSAEDATADIATGRDASNVRTAHGAITG